jgi:hypothetical protein
MARLLYASQAITHAPRALLLCTPWSKINAALGNEAQGDGVIGPK